MIVRLKDGRVARVLVAVGYDMRVETIGRASKRINVSFKNVTIDGLTDHPENKDYSLG